LFPARTGLALTESVADKLQETSAKVAEERKIEKMKARTSFLIIGYGFGKRV
jgi:hypothetical protein